GNVNRRNIAVIGTDHSFIAEGKLGVGITDPAATLDVDGRIMRKSQAFTFVGVGLHDEVIPVPWGTTNDWNIFVSPRSMGMEEPGSEFDNALLVIHCWAALEATFGFRIHCRYKFKQKNADNSGDGDWHIDGTVNWILVPR